MIKLKKCILEVVSAEEAENRYGSVKGHPMLFFETLESRDIMKEYEPITNSFFNKYLFISWITSMIILIVGGIITGINYFFNGALWLLIIPILSYCIFRGFLSYLIEREEKRNKNIYNKFFESIPVEKLNGLRKKDIVYIKIEIEKEKKNKRE